MNRGQSRRAVNIALALVALSLVALVLFTQGALGTDAREARENHLFGVFAESGVQSFAVIRQGEPETLVQRTPEGFQLVKPAAQEVDEDAVEEYLGHLQFATWERQLADTAGVQAGLERPHLTLKLSVGEESYELSLGGFSVSPPGSVYARVTAADGSAKTGIITGTLASQLAVEPGYFRPTWLVPYLSSALRELALTGPAQQVTLVGRDNGRWYVEQDGRETRASRKGVDFLLAQFGRMDAMRFLPVDEAKAAQAGASTVQIKMTPSREEAPQGILVVGGACPDVPGSVVALRVAPEPAAGCVPADVMAGLRQTPEQLKDQRAFPYRPDEVQEWAVQLGDKHLALVRKEEGWQAQKPVDASVEGKAGDARLSRLLNLRGEPRELTEPLRLAFQKPRGKLTLRAVSLREDAVPDTVLIGPVEPDGGVLLLREDDQALFRIPPLSTAAWDTDVAFLRDRALLSLPETDITQVQVTGQHGQLRVERGETGDLILVHPDAVDGDAAVLRGWLSGLSQLHAERWVSETAKNEYGLGEPSLVVRFLVEPVNGQEAWRTLKIGSVTRGGAFARLDEVPGVFVLPRSVLNQLRQLPADRGVFGFDLAMVESVTLKARGVTLTMLRQGEQWALKEPAPGMDPGRVGEIVLALSRLSAVGAVHLGGGQSGEGFERPVADVSVQFPSGGGRSFTYLIGSADTWDDESIYYARRRGVDATYALPRRPVRQILEWL